MPSQQVQKLVPSRTFSQNEWIEIAEGRRLMLKSHLLRYTLPALKDLKCLRDGRVGVQSLANAGYPDLKIQGIWSDRFPESLATMKGWSGFWGLSREGEWLLVQLKIKTKHWTEIVEDAFAQPTSLQRLAKEFEYVLPQICAGLRTQVLTWHSSLQQQLTEITGLRRILNEDEELMRLTGNA